VHRRRTKERHEETGHDGWEHVTHCASDDCEWKKAYIRNNNEQLNERRTSGNEDQTDLRKEADERLENRLKISRPEGEDPLRILKIKEHSQTQGFIQDYLDPMRVSERTEGDVTHRIQKPPEGQDKSVFKNHSITIHSWLHPDHPSNLTHYWNPEKGRWPSPRIAGGDEGEEEHRRGHTDMNDTG
jgi:hypothetical protein